MQITTFNYSRFNENARLLLLERVIRAGATLLMVVLIARHLGKGDFGSYSYLVAFGGFFLPLVGLGLESVASRIFAERPLDRGQILGSMLGLKTAGGIFAALFAWGTLSVLDGFGSTRTFLIFPLGLALCFQAFETFEYHFQSIADQRLTTWVRLGGLAFGVSCRLFLYFSQSPLYAFLWVFPAESAFNAFGFFLVYRISKTPPIQFSYQEARRLLRESWPLAVSSLAILFYMRIDQVMLEKLAGPEALGAYAVAVRFSESWFLIPTAVATAALPLLVQTRGQSQKEFLEAYQHMNTRMTLLSLGAGTFLTLAGPFLITSIFGPNYRDAGGILVVSGWSGIFVAWGVFRGAALNAKGVTHFQLAATFVGAALNISLNFIMIPKWGALGAAWATLLSQFASAHLSGWFFAPARFSAEIQIRSLNPIQLWQGILSFKQRPFG